MNEAIKPPMEKTSLRNKLIVAALVLLPVIPLWLYAFAETIGVVVDAATGQPIEGAYVLATYNDSGGAWMGHSASWCIRTAGMYTGKDGRFSFPSGGKLRLNQPLRLVFRGAFNHTPEIAVIKPDYFFGNWDYDDLSKYPLVKQDPAKPIYQYGTGGGCRAPESREAAEASITFLQLEKEELIRTGPAKFGSEEMARVLANADSRIQSLKKVAIDAQVGK